MNYDRIYKTSFSLSLLTTVGWVAILSVALSRSAQLQDILSNNKIKCLLPIILSLTILSEILFLINNTNSVKNELKATEQPNYKKRLTSETSALIATFLFFGSSVLSLISVFDDSSTIGIIDSSLSLSSELFSILSAFFSVYIGIKKLQSLKNNLDNNQEINNRKNERKYLRWDVANNTVILALTLINTLYNIDEVLGQKFSNDDVKTHNIIKLVSLICYGAITISVFILYQLEGEKNFNSNINNVNITYVDQANFTRL